MFEEVKSVYDFLEDEESKRIFRYRLLFSLTHDWNYLKEMLVYYVDENKGYYNILDVLAQPDLFREKEIILFGTGLWGGCIPKWLEVCGLKYDYYCDNDPRKAGKEFGGRKILSPRELFEEHREAVVLVTTEKYEQEVVEQLLDNGFKNEQIVRFSYAKDKIYIDDNIVQPMGNEIYIDGGCYDGESSFEFLKWAKGSVEKVYAFEPDHVNYLKCEKNMKENCEVPYEIFPAGLWSEKTVLTFENELGQGSHISDQGKIEIPMVSIDEVVGNDKVTFIKMDIEGAELEALKGAKRTIEQNKPRLAICLYHKDEDILEIPNYIKKLVPEYKIYIRHYLPYTYDTILYATI